MQKTPIIIGIDPGTRVTGYGVVLASTKPEALDFGCIRPPLKYSIHDRYRVIFESIEELIEKFQPNAMAVESQFVYKNVQTAMKLGMARGMVLLAASRKQIPIFEYAPKKAKLAIVGNGAASKQQVQKMVQMLLQLATPPEPEDAADALALALCHAHTLSYRSMVNL